MRKQVEESTAAESARRATRPARRRPHGSGGRVVAVADSAPLHRRRPRRRHRGARDGAQWPGRARVRTDGARRVHHGSHAGRQLENRPHGRALLGGRDRRTRGRPKVSVGRGLLRSRARRMTDTQRPWDRLTTESDPAYEAFAAYLDTGSLRDAYRQRSGNEKAPPSHRRDSQSASRHAAIREQRQRLREHLIQPGVLERHAGHHAVSRSHGVDPPSQPSRRRGPSCSRRA